jgi:hypothetical protein
VSSIIASRKARNGYTDSQIMSGGFLGVEKGGFDVL